MEIDGAEMTRIPAAGCAGMSARGCFLDDLAAELLRAIVQLERSSNPYARAWAAHFRTDRGAVLLLAGTWREPSEPLTRGSIET